MPLTIFVSHSTNKGPKDSDDLVTAKHRRFLDDLQQRLDDFEDPDGQRLFRVLVDKENLKTGDPWRKKLIDGLGTCSAGIVLLNKKAITKSDWVLAEANILRWRDWREESFRLVLVALGKGSRKAFGATAKWRPLAFEEVQFLAGGEELEGPKMPKAAFAELTSQLPRTIDAGLPTSFEALELSLQVELEAALRGAGKAMAPAEAKRLMEEGPAGLNGLAHRCGPYLDADNWLRVVEAIACWWIDPSSSSSLAKAVDSRAPQRSFSVTGEKMGFTPRLYVRHACFLPPRLSWKVADKITASSGRQAQKAFQDKVVGEVRENLVKIYRNAWDDPHNVSDAEIKQLIRDYLARRPPRPTFVALPSHIATDTGVKDAILAAFPSLAFLHLTPDPAVARAISGCQPLEPLPKLEEESKAHSAYSTAKGLLDP